MREYDRGRAVWRTERAATATRFVLRPGGRAGDWTNVAAGSAPAWGAGVATRTLYDAAGRAAGTERRRGVAVEVEPDPNRPGHHRARASAEGTVFATTSTRFDAAGRAVETTDAAGLRSGTAFGPDGSALASGTLRPDAPGRWWEASLPVGAGTPAGEAALRAQMGGEEKGSHLLCAHPGYTEYGWGGSARLWVMARRNISRSRRPGVRALRAEP